MLLLLLGDLIIFLVGRGRFTCLDEELALFTFLLHEHPIIFYLYINTFIILITT